jgi:RNA polymerase sigma-70 factor (ECF subfamily)
MASSSSETQVRPGCKSSDPLPEDFTVLLRRMGSGDAHATTDLFTLVYGTLRAQARSAMRGQPRSHTLQPTALANEVFLKLANQRVAWEGRSHFLCVAAQAMRSVLVDHAKGKGRRKRKAAGRRINLDEHVAAFESRSAHLLDLDEALQRLAQDDPRASQIVEMRFFGGMQFREIAEKLDVPQRTVERDWTYARTWLHAELR